MTGLNAGFETEDELNANTQDTPEVVEIEKETESAIIAVEEFLYKSAHLAAVLDKVVASHGMSQTYAMEANNFMEFVTNERPLGVFTSIPTGTGYKKATEEMSGGIMALIAAAVAALAAIIYKVIKWLWGGSKSSSSGSASGYISGSTSEAMTSTTPEAAKQIDDAMKNAVTEVKEADKALRSSGTSMDKLLKDYGTDENTSCINQLTKEVSPFVYDALTNGDYFQFCTEFLKASAVWPYEFSEVVAKLKAGMSAYLNSGDVRKEFGADTWKAFMDKAVSIKEEINDPNSREKWNSFFPRNYFIRIGGKEYGTGAIKDEMMLMEHLLAEKGPQKFQDLGKAMELVSNKDRHAIFQAWGKTLDKRNEGHLETTRKDLVLMQEMFNNDYVKAIQARNKAYYSGKVDGEKKTEDDLKAGANGHARREVTEFEIDMKGYGTNQYTKEKQPDGSYKFFVPVLEPGQRPKEPDTMPILDTVKGKFPDNGVDVEAGLLGEGTPEIKSVTKFYRELLSEISHAMNNYIYIISKCRRLYIEGVVHADRLFVGACEELNQLNNKFVDEEIEHIRKQDKQNAEEEIKRLNESKGLFKKVVKIFKFKS